MTIFLLIRHGETDYVGKRLAGHLPGIHLNKHGRQQAAGVAELLAQSPIRAIYASPLERAMETAQPLAECLNLTVIPMPGLMEINFGDWQGKTTKQMQRMKLWKTVVEEPSKMRFPHGETFSEAQQRLTAVLDELVSHHQADDWVAVFSHCDSIRLLIAHYLDMPLDAFQRLSIGTGSISVLYMGKGSPHLGVINYSVGQAWQPRPA